MSELEHDLEPMPGDVERLLESERPLLPPPPGADETVLAMVGATLLATPVSTGSAAGGPAAGSAQGAGTLKALLASRVVTGAVLFALGGASGAGLHVLAQRAAPNAAPAPPSSPAPAPAVVVEPAKVEVREAAPRARDGTLAAERKLLEAARTALAHGQSAAALEQLERHAASFPDGQLAEEREALGVQALVATKRFDEARARSARFERAYPGSILLPAVKAALESIR
jgi:hypothetical protein